MNKYEWNTLNGQQQDIWSLSLDQLDQIIYHINTIIITKTKELEAELEVADQERDEAVDSSAEKSIQESNTNLQTYLRDYITFLMLLMYKLEEYRNDMADTFQVNDINRKIYLDYFGLDNWVEELKNDLDIDSKYINDIVNDSDKLIEWEVDVETKFNDKVDFNDGGSGFLGSDRNEEKNYEEAKIIYKEASYEIQKALKFEEELDYIINNVSEAKGIKGIEDAFVIEELIQIIEQAQKGNYDGIEKVKVKVMDKFINKSKESIKDMIFSDDAINMLRELEGGPPPSAQCQCENGLSGSKSYLVGDTNDNGVIDEGEIWDEKYTFGHGMAFNTEQEGYDFINDITGGNYKKGSCIKSEDLEYSFLYQLNPNEKKDINGDDYIGYSLNNFLDVYNDLNLSQGQIDALLLLAYNIQAPFIVNGPYDQDTYQVLASNPSKDEFYEYFRSHFGNVPTNNWGWDVRVINAMELYYETPPDYTYDFYTQKDAINILKDWGISEEKLIYSYE